MCQSLMEVLREAVKEAPMGPLHESQDTKSTYLPHRGACETTTRSADDLLQIIRRSSGVILNEG